MTGDNLRDNQITEEELKQITVDIQIAETHDTDGPKSKNIQITYRGMKFNRNQMYYFTFEDKKKSLLSGDLCGAIRYDSSEKVLDDDTYKDDLSIVKFKQVTSTDEKDDSMVEVNDPKNNAKFDSCGKLVPDNKHSYRDKAENFTQAQEKTGMERTMPGQHVNTPPNVRQGQSVKNDESSDHNDADESYSSDEDNKSVDDDELPKVENDDSCFPTPKNQAQKKLSKDEVENKLDNYIKTINGVIKVSNAGVKFLGGKKKFKKIVRAYFLEQQDNVEEINFEPLLRQERLALQVISAQRAREAAEAVERKEQAKKAKISQDAQRARDKSKKHYDKKVRYKLC